MRKCFWWLVSLFKQCICAFRQNDLVFNISVDYFLSADSVLDILKPQEGNVFRDAFVVDTH